MYHVGLKEILSANPALAHATHGIQMEPKPRYYTFELPKFTVQVDSTAYKVTDSIARFSRTHQLLIIQGIIDRLPNPGDSIILKEDVLLGQETAVITRGRAEGPGIKLVFAR